MVTVAHNGDRGLIVGKHCYAITVTEVIIGTLITFVQQRHEHVVGVHCCLTNTSVGISATMAYVMLCKENLWNVSVLHREHLSNLVIFLGLWYGTCSALIT
jgi:hypothetical protein